MTVIAHHAAKSCCSWRRSGAGWCPALLLVLRARMAEFAPPEASAALTVASQPSTWPGTEDAFLDAAERS